MAITTQYFAYYNASNVAVAIGRYYRCDTEAEMQAISSPTEGDAAYCVDTGKRWHRKATEWTAGTGSSTKLESHISLYASEVEVTYS